MTTTAQQEYPTQVYHAASMTIQNDFQYPMPVSPTRSSSPTSYSNTAPLTPSSYEDDNDGDICNLKSSTDVYRQRGANIRALALLEVEITGTIQNPKAQAAAKKGEREREEKMEQKVRLKKEKEAFAKRGPVLVAKKAETTRKVKPSSEEDVGIETIAEMKCQLDLDREEQAKYKALSLLENGFMY
jgi:hypothetical protein